MANLNRANTQEKRILTIPEEFKHTKLSEKKYPKVTFKPEDICIKSPFNKITKYKGVIDYKYLQV